MDFISSDLDSVLARLRSDRTDEVAWGALYDRLTPRARALGYRWMGGDVGLAEDVAHDALEKLVRYADFERLRRTEDVVRYFSTIVRNAAVDALRRRAVEPEPSSLSSGRPESDDLGYTEEEAEAASDSPEAWLEYQRIVERLESSLDQRDRLLLAMLIDGYNRLEMAARLGAPPQTVAVWVHRLRLRLRELIP